MAAGGSLLITAEDARAIARQEIASLCGLILRRLQDVEAYTALEITVALERILGEALRDFSATRSEPGPTS